MAGSEHREQWAVGPIAWMARNPVAANLLLFVVLLAGFIGMGRVKQEVFPEFSLDLVTVVVAYPGASPEEVEKAVLLAIEDEVTGLDGVNRVTSAASEGAGTVAVELLLGADPQAVLADVKNAVDRVRTLPEDAEEPQVSLASSRREVISLVVYGDDLDLNTLYALGEKVERELKAYEGIEPAPQWRGYSPLHLLGYVSAWATRGPVGGVTQVEVFGIPEPEVSIEVPETTLMAHGLTLEGIAQQVRASSVELPGGGVRAASGELLVRVSDRRLREHEFANIPIVSTARGARLTLGDIGTIREGFAETDQASYYDGRPAVRITAYRVGSETPQSVADTVVSYAEQLRADLPENVGIAIWQDDSQRLRDRIDLLVRNGAMGLVLVLLVLAAFLDLRLAFWVAAGIPASFLGTFLLMPGFDLSINMITLFAFIVTLGMVVDDAIVVGENVYARREAGTKPLRAAIEGAQEMAVPVSFSILTTVAAFAPLLFIPGVMGKLFSFIPLIVIGVLTFSLIESFFILPAHLAHMKASKGQGRISKGLEDFITQRFEPALRQMLAFRYVLVASAVAMLVFAVGSVASGLVPFSFFPVLEGDLVKVSATLPYGTPVERTLAVRAELEEALEATRSELGDGVIKAVFTRVGEGARTGGPGARSRAVGSHLLAIEVELVPSDDRTISAEQVSAVWREHTPPLAGLESLVFTANVGPSAGEAVDVQLSHPDVEVLAAASAELQEQLAEYSSLTNIQNSYVGGKPQISYAMRPQGLDLGLTAGDVARQVRAAFYGSEALRDQRGNDEFKVMVRLPRAERGREASLENLRVRTPMGGYAPLAEVAVATRGRAPTEIKRESGQRVVNVSGERKPGVASTNDVVASVEAELLPALIDAHPGLHAELVGEQREQGEAFGALRVNYALGVFVIYALLAIPFRSYTQPFIIMSAIPFGLIGAIAGHALMGYELSVISTLGMTALSGVVVNDSLVLIDATNARRREGASAEEAIIYGATRRFRPILLTSLTTFFGLVPMIAETSVQARFLIPMALSLGFGVLFATVLILVVVPALYLILEDGLSLLPASAPHEGNLPGPQDDARGTPQPAGDAGETDANPA
ncbi:MAG: efflux RND transporter permease subunit [Deltaproteobacteria bacterium]|nr:MAG: efflux RND transporter permease subunit [Deltaproteobacteria bacterium]